MKATDYLALSIATCGVGYLPLMPGTFGSLLAVGIFLLFARSLTGSSLIAVVLVLILAFTVAGIWAATRTEQLSGRKDPGKVVVDEVAGQFIALFPVTLFTRWSTAAVIVSFILFRFFDIVKPYPANRLQELNGGAGVMFDDLVAGVYGAVIVLIMLKVFRSEFMERKESIGKDATSKETLKDLEENEAEVSDTSDDSEMPSPDGAFDDSDDLKKADPT